MNRKLQAGTRILAAVYAVLLLSATHAPRVPLTLTGGDALPLDKLLHFLAYAVLAFLVAAGTPGLFRRPLVWAPLILGMVGLFGACDELTQPLFGRTADPLDWLANMAGAIAGLAMAVASAYAWKALVVTICPPDHRKQEESRIHSCKREGRVT